MATAEKTVSMTALDVTALEETADRFGGLNEKLIELAKEQGRASLDVYETALQELVDFSGLAKTHAKFVQDVGGSYLKLAREALK